MARVKYIEEETTDNPVIKESFERMRKKRGKVTNIYKALAHKPSILSTIGPFVAAVQQPEELLVATLHVTDGVGAHVAAIQTKKAQRRLRLEVSGTATCPGSP